VFVVLFVCCLIVVPLPPGENPFAVNNNNNNNNNNKIITSLNEYTTFNIQSCFYTAGKCTVLFS
jgi:hypothetical protein